MPRLKLYSPIGQDRFRQLLAMIVAMTDKDNPRPGDLNDEGGALQMQIALDPEEWAIAQRWAADDGTGLDEAIQMMACNALYDSQSAEPNVLPFETAVPSGRVTRQLEIEMHIGCWAGVQRLAAASGGISLDKAVEALARAGLHEWEAGRLEVVH